MAQSQDKSAVYNILAFRFDGQKGAEEALKRIKSSGELDGYKITAQAIVEKDQNGKLHMHETGHGTLGSVAGAGIGGLLGLIGGPAGLLAWAIAGGVVGGVAGKYLGRALSKGDMQEIGAALPNNSSALLMLLEDTQTEGVIKSMQGYSANVATLVVGDQLSGEIAAYAAGDAKDASGNEVAGAGGVAADAAGDVAAGGVAGAATGSGAASTTKS
jgi:uncharacterized membrane protein